MDDAAPVKCCSNTRFLVTLFNADRTQDLQQAQGIRTIFCGQLVLLKLQYCKSEDTYS